MTCLQQHRIGRRAGATLCALRCRANTIGDALTCTTNVPAPINAGASNAVGGERSGQTCALLMF
jgi:hypothetical protein